MLTPEEQERIREEERERLKARPMTPVNQIANCGIWGCVIAVSAIILFAVAIAGMVSR